MRTESTLTGAQATSPLSAGWIWVEGCELFGVASDLEIVRLGNIPTSPDAKRGAWCDKSTARYLETHPTPDMW